MCEKTNEREAESIIFILVFSSFLSVKSFLNIWVIHFSLLTIESFKHSFTFSNWVKTVIRIIFLSVSMTWTVKYCQKLAIFKFLFLFHFVIIFYSLSSNPLPAWPLFLIVIHNGVKKIQYCDVYRKENCLWFCSYSLPNFTVLELTWPQKIDLHCLFYL